MNTEDLPHIILGMNKSEINNVEYKVLDRICCFIYTLPLPDQK